MPQQVPGLNPRLFNGFRSTACGFAVYQSHRLLLKNRIEIVLDFERDAGCIPMQECISSVGHPGGSKPLFYRTEIGAHFRPGPWGVPEDFPNLVPALFASFKMVR